MSGVFVGMPGPWADDYREPSDPFTCKVGGIPDWPFSKDSIIADLLRCATCSTQLCLVTQVYAPLSQHRLLFIFGCVSPKCGTFWRVLRVQKVADVDNTPTKLASSSSSSNEVQNANSLEDFNDDEDEHDLDLEALGRALFDAGTLASNSKTKSKKSRRKSRQHKLPASSSPTTTTTTLVHTHHNYNDNDVPVVPCFYLYTMEEPSSGDLSSVCASYSSLYIKENGDGEDQSQTEETWENEHYEYDKALTADRTYLKFKKRLDAYPEQCFRYSYSGKPILAAAAEINPGSCSLCGRPRQFEMQLMPPLLFFLQEALDHEQRQMVENWDWMTLIVYTCSESCCEETEQSKSNSKGWIVAEEAVVAQNEESMPIQLGYFS